MKLSVFYDHILQAAEQTGRAIPDLLNEVSRAGIEAVEINMTYLREHEETLGLLHDAGLSVSCVYEFYGMEASAERLKALRHVKTADRRHFSAPLTKQKRLYKIKYNLCIQ